VQERDSRVQLYSAHDPYLMVAKLTNGTMVLANENVNELALGLATMLMGVIFCLPFCISLVVVFIGRRVDRRQKAQEQAKQAQEAQLEVAISNLSLPVM
jgi:hypothetical protein